MHLEVNNDVEFDLKNESTSKRNRKSKKSTSTKRTMKVSGLKSKALMPSIIINGKRLPVKSKSRKMSASAGTKKKAMTMQSRRKPSKNDARSMKSKRASGKLVRDARGRFAEKKSSKSIRKNSSKRSRSMKSKSASRNLIRDDMGRWSMKSKSGSGKLVRDARGRFAEKKASGSKQSRSIRKKSNMKSESKKASGKLDRVTVKSKPGQAQAGAKQTIYMPIQQASNGETAEAIVVKNDESAKNKVDVTDVKIVEK